MIFPGDEFPENRFSLIKGENIELKDFYFKSSYASCNPEYDSYTAVLFNYEREEDPDSRPLNDGEVKLVIMLYNEEGIRLKPGEYRLESEFNSGGNLFSIAILTNKKEFYATASESEDSSRIVLLKANDKMLSGRINIEDSNGVIVKGAFSTKNVIVMQE